MDWLGAAGWVLAWLGQWLATIWLGEVVAVVAIGTLIWLVSLIRSGRDDA